MKKSAYVAIVLFFLPAQNFPPDPAVTVRELLKIYNISKVIIFNDLMNIRLHLIFKISPMCRIISLKFGLLLNFSGV